jgi:hypothetical protein
MSDRDKLKEKIARAISREDGIMAGEASDFAEWHWEESLDHADAALSAIEAEGYVIRPGTDDVCQASPGIKGETVSREGALQSDNGE